MKPAPSLKALRRYAIARSLFKPTGLMEAIDRLGYVQADPMRAPARAQDLILLQRVRGYRAGELERRYTELPVEEDCLVNYGFLPRRLMPLMHPRRARHPWKAEDHARAAELHAFIAERGPTHPRDVLAAFQHGRVPGYWGGSLNASTQLLDGMHYRSQLRVARRDAGTRVYELARHPEADDSPAARAQAARALVDLVLAQYAPLPGPTFNYLVQKLSYGAPHLREECRAALAEARQRLPQAELAGQRWYWPEGEHPADDWGRPAARVRLLAPFDPVVWDRLRFELFWGWAYRFEAYTPAAKRQMGHYALPLLWRDEIIGWANLRWDGERLDCDTGYVSGQPPAGAAFDDALQAELARLRAFLREA